MLVFVVCCPLVKSTHAATVEQLELAYIYKFLSFVTLADFSDPEIIVVVFGHEKFGDDLHSLAKKTVRGKNIIIKPYLTSADLEGCDVVFITDIATADISAILKQVKDDRCLTIGDTPSFIDRGGKLVLFQNEANYGLRLIRRWPLQMVFRLIPICLKWRVR